MEFGLLITLYPAQAIGGTIKIYIYKYNQEIMLNKQGINFGVCG